MNEDLTYLALQGRLPYKCTGFESFLHNEVTDETIYQNSITYVFTKSIGYKNVARYYTPIRWDEVSAEYMKEFVRLANE